MSFRPAGLSEDEDSDDEFSYTPVRRPNLYQERMDRERKINTALQDAIETGNIDKLKELIVKDLNKNPNARLGSGWTLLMHACQNAQHSVVEYLLSCGADVNQHCDSLTPMIVLCANEVMRNESVISLMYALLEKGAHIGVGDKYGQTPLMKAVGAGNVNLVKELLKQHINIEMRDEQGWTAAFWAVHHNQPEILEMLIAKNCRLNEVDRHGRNLLEIAQSHDFEDVLDILKSHFKENNNNECAKIIHRNAEWTDFCAGINGSDMPTYKHEIPNLLYGMNCERVSPLFEVADIDLRTFLLLDEDAMVKLGVEMPYERKRLTLGLRKFHTRAWKVNSVSGLYAKTAENYSMMDCLTSLNSHLYQIYILEASLQYTLRCLANAREKLKFELDDSAVLKDLNGAANQVAEEIERTRTEVKNIRTLIETRNKDNPPAPELVRSKRKSKSYLTQNGISNILVCCVFAAFVCGFKSLMNRSIIIR